MLAKKKKCQKLNNFPTWSLDPHELLRRLIRQQLLALWYLHTRNRICTVQILLRLLNEHSTCKEEMPAVLFHRALGVGLLPDGAPGYMEFDQLPRTQTPMVSLLYSFVNEESRGLSIRYFGF